MSGAYELPDITELRHLVHEERRVSARLVVALDVSITRLRLAGHTALADELAANQRRALKGSGHRAGTSETPA